MWTCVNIICQCKYRSSCAQILTEVCEHPFNDLVMHENDVINIIYIISIILQLKIFFVLQPCAFDYWDGNEFLYKDL